MSNNTESDDNPGSKINCTRVHKYQGHYEGHKDKNHKVQKVAVTNTLVQGHIQCQKVYNVFKNLK